MTPKKKSNSYRYKNHVGKQNSSKNHANGPNSFSPVTTKNLSFPLNKNFIPSISTAVTPTPKKNYEQNDDEFPDLVISKEELLTIDNNIADVQNVVLFTQELYGCKLNPIKLMSSNSSSCESSQNFYLGTQIGLSGSSTSASICSSEESIEIDHSLDIPYEPENYTYEALLTMTQSLDHKTVQDYLKEDSE